MRLEMDIRVPCAMLYMDPQSHTQLSVGFFSPWNDEVVLSFFSLGICSWVNKIPSCFEKNPAYQ